VPNLYCLSFALPVPDAFVGTVHHCQTAIMVVYV